MALYLDDFFIMLMTEIWITHKSMFQFHLIYLELDVKKC